jgi:hypothetical protein
MVFLSNDTRKRLVLVALSLALWGACSRVDVTVFEDPADVRANGGGAPLGGLGGASGPIPGDGLGGFGGEVDVLVDDFEDGDTKAIDPAQWWYGVNDGTGTQTISVIASAELEAPPLANGSFVLQVTSAGFSGWGAAFGLDVAGFDFGPARPSEK